MKTYVGTKIIKAEPMSESMFLHVHKGKEFAETGTEGYHVIYPNPEGNYHSWSPKDVFENANRELSPGETSFVKSEEEK